MRLYLPYVFEALEWDALTTYKKIRENSFFQISYDQKGFVEYVIVLNDETHERSKLNAEVIDSEDGKRVIQCGEFTFIYENNKLISYPEVFNAWSSPTEEDKQLMCNISYEDDIIREVSGSTKFIYYFNSKAEELFNKLKETYKALEGEETPTLIVEFINGANYKTIYRLFSSKDSISTLISIKSNSAQPKVTIKYNTPDDIQVHALSGIKSPNEEQSKLLDKIPVAHYVLDEYNLYYNQHKNKDGCSINLVDNNGYYVYTHDYIIDIDNLIHVIKKPYMNEDGKTKKKILEKKVRYGSVKSYTEYFAIFDVTEDGLKKIETPTSSKISRTLDYDF